MANEETHLLRTRGGSQCGKPGPCTAEINDVGCVDCKTQHEEIAYRNTYNALARQLLDQLDSKCRHHEDRIERGTADDEDYAAKDFYDSAYDRIKQMILPIS